MIGIQTTTISWVLEFLGGAVVFLSYSLVKNRDECTDLITLLFVVSLDFIFIPASYLMISAKYMPRVLEQGWYTFLSTPLDISNRISPSRFEGLELHNINKGRESSDTAYEGSIHSISGSIAATER